MDFSHWYPFLFISSLFLSVHSFVFNFGSIPTESSSSCRLGQSTSIGKRRGLTASRSSAKALLLLSSSKRHLPFNETSFKERKDGVKVLGICGGIASGKSKACQILVSHPNITNCIVGYIDADQLAHKLYDNISSPMLKQILRAFGPNVFTLTNNNSTSSKLQLDRKALGNVVFADPERMSVLEQIVWPQLKQKLVEQLFNLKQHYSDNNSSAKSVVVVEAAVMLEAGWEDILDAVWLLRSPHQHKFLVEHRNHSPDQANMKIEAQSHRRGINKTTIKEELAKGVVTTIIDNDGDIDSLTQKLIYAWNDPDCWKHF